MNRIRFDLLILLIVFGAPVLQWAITKMREHAEEARKKREFDRQRTEALRTGQTPPVRVDPREEAKARQAAVAAARQEKLRELRERAVAEAEARRRQTAMRTGRGTAPPGPTRAPGASPTMRRAPAPIRSAPTPTRTGQSDADRLNAARQRQIEELRRRQREQAKRTQTKPSLAPAMPQQQESRLQSVFTQQAGVARPVAPITEIDRPRKRGIQLTTADARRGIILAELLAPPLAIRNQDPLRRF